MPAACPGSEPSSEPPVEAVLAAVGAGLPAGFWSMPVLVAVSGGADSVAMLLALCRLVAADAVERLVVIHAEHDLRAEAAADGRFVAGLAERLGLSCVSRRVAVRASGLRGEGLEATARRLRYDFFAAAARDLGARYVVVAHTADDQAETILHRALRGTGLQGLSGMPEARSLCEGVSLVRPLLRTSRRLVRKFLAEVGGDWREDATNTATIFARNFLRHEILPRCVQGPYPAASESLVRLGRQAAGAAAALRSAAEHLLESHSQRHSDGGVVLQAARLSGLDRQLLAEIFLVLWCREQWPQRDMTEAHYVRLVRLAALAADCEGTLGAAGTGGDFPGGVRVAVPVAGRLHFSRRPTGAGS